MEVTYSVAGVPVRLTDERWTHILENRPDVADYQNDLLRTVSQPDFILRGHGGTLEAIKSFGRHRYLKVVYRETSRSDGFIITAYFVRSINRRLIIWRR